MGNRIGHVIAAVFSCLVSAAGANGAITITCLPDQLVVSGGALVTVECTIESTEDVEIFGVQLDLPCALRRGPDSSGTAIRETQFVNLDHQSPPFLFATKKGNPIAVINTRECRASLTPGFLEPSAFLPANEPRYLASISYRISQCARGSFPIRLEEFNNPPTDADLTLVRDDLRRLLPFTVVTGQISSPNGCMCETNPVCNDDNPCTSDSCVGGFCRNLPNTSTCDDGLFCYAGDRCSNGLCIGESDACVGFTGCDEVDDFCYDCRVDGNCPIPSNECKTARCSAGLCFEIDRVGSCDDLQFCTANDVCDGGQCVGTGTPCGPEELCDEPSQSCIPFGCPDTFIVDSDPPSQVIDARQPHPPDANDLSSRTGIGGQGEPIFLFLGLGGAGPDCFFLDETAVEEGTNANLIANVHETEPRVFRFFLSRPITTGAVTYLSYNDGSSAAFVSHPGNVNADGTSDADDVLSLAGYLNGDADPPYGVYSFDINHSGDPDLDDLMAEVNLLNGADLFSPWNGTNVPE